MDVIRLTDGAAAKLRQLLGERKGKHGIRLRLISSGCDVYTYDLDFGTKPVGDEIKVASKGVDIFLERKSIGLIEGTEIDYDEAKEGFVFNNPKTRKPS